ncbi:alginate O-acetyltransferase AlgF [Pseudomonas qingdaonensis]|uniref:alginate O-acetyltransferase AlgF n=1 Tax=Pseudomonas qingdaonensis TaxID=2056231 RepID=UPI001F2F40FA|nr:alginate O-acetyltransferase AlgF [Pseudomonas qingdaonensis]
MKQRSPALRAALLLGACLSGSAQAEGVLAQLYAPRPAAGSAFVRVVNPGTQPLQVQVSRSSVQTLGPAQVAGSYAIVKGGEDFTVTVNGKPAGTLKVAPDSFNTLVPHKGTWKVVDDVASSDDALKAELRFYNLADDCAKGTLSVADGPTLFEHVPAQTSTARAINPVTALLTAGCGEALAERWPLPQLNPGDHYALFLTGDSKKPVLRGQLSSTDTYAQ